MEPSDDFLRKYRDVFTIRIELGSVYEPVADEVFEVSHPAAAWSREDAINELDSLTRDDRIVRAAGSGCCGASAPFTLDVRRSVTSWGADAASEELVLRLAEWASAGIVGTAAYHAVKDLLRRFAAATSEPTWARAIERSEALGLAEWAVSARFGLPEPSQWVRDAASGGLVQAGDESLTLVEERDDAGSWTFVFRCRPYEYEVKVERLDGYATLTHSRRSRMPSA